jgi:hypothetical protein
MKKGQITIFIILGLILLISLAVTIYFFSVQDKKFDVHRAKLPEDIRPVYDMVSDCAKIALKQGLIIQGLQSGYVTVPAFVTSNPESFISGDPFNTIIIPYWYYRGENLVPGVPLMQRQLGNFVRDQILDCVDLKAFEPKLEVKEFGLPEVSVVFADKDTVAEVKWLLEIKTPERTTVISDYFAVQNIRYNEMYDLAFRILEEENKQQWLEKLTIDFLSGDKDIPTGGMEISCRQKKWDLEKVQARLKEILFYTIPMVRIKNTPQLKPLAERGVYEDLKKWNKQEQEKLLAGITDDLKIPKDIPEDVYEINKMVFDVNIPPTDLKASFIYDGSKLMMNAKPRDGRWLKSKVVKEAKMLIPFFCINQWHFTYDIIYPVKLVIKDENAFDGEGYVFQMAFPVIIKDNFPERKNFGIRQFDFVDLGEGFCEEKGEELIEVNVYSFEPGFPVAVELEDAEVVVQCVSLECSLGKTKIQYNGRINLIDYIPDGCGNPRIIAKKEGYLDKGVWLTGNKAEISLVPLKKLVPEFVIMPYLAPTGSWQVDQNRFKLEDNEKIVFSMKLKEENFEQYFVFPDDEKIEFALKDAEYELEAYLLKNDILIGGFKNLNLTITYDEIIGKDKIQINLVEYRPNPVDDQDLLKMMDFLEKGECAYNRKCNVALKPLFK